MRVIVSDACGFCAGVQRAIGMALAAKKSCQGRVFIDGEIVHNKQVISSLEASGLLTLKAEERGNFSEHDIVLTRAHGTAAERQLELRSMFKNIMDGTCPHVQKTAKNIHLVCHNGGCVIIIGDRNHPEVVALCDAANSGACFVVGSVQEIDLLPSDLDNVYVCAQSTILKLEFDELSKIIVEKYKNVKVNSTICMSSQNRQMAIAKLIDSGAQAIIVVGGLHSNNTRTLHKIAQTSQLPAFHIETSRGIPFDDIKMFDVVGVISGASTAMTAVDEVVSALKRI